MKNRKIYLLTWTFLLCFVLASAQNSVIITGTQAYESFTDTEITISDNSELWLTSSTPLVNSTIQLETEDSWVYFENIRPSAVVSSWLKYVYIGSELASNGRNVRVEIYKHGAVVIPHAPSYLPLEVFTEENFGGESKKYEILTYHTNLGEFRNAIRSFKLKKGYMATFATKSDGTGYSRVFIADSEDLKFAEMPSAELDQTVNFIRIFKWKWPSKKGWSGSDTNDLSKVQSTWCYNWDAESSAESYLDAEYVPMRHGRWWPGWETINSRQNSTHVLGFNEPDQNDDGGGSDMSVDECIAQWPELMKSGLRIGSPGCTDGGANWIVEFVQKCDALGYRVDFVAVHFYRGGNSPQQFYSYLKDIHTRTGGRPIWVTEWNNGANWTTESWPSSGDAQQQKQLEDMTGFFHMLDTCSFVERHAVYNWVEDKRALILNGALTPAGEMMRDHNARIAYDPAGEIIPKYVYKDPVVSSSSLSADKSTYTVNITNDNDNLITACLAERQVNDGDYVVIDSVINITTNTLSFKFDADPSGFGKFSYRFRYLTKSGKYTDYTTPVSYTIVPKDEMVMERVSYSSTGWNSIYFANSFSSIPVAILGTPTNNNSLVLMSEKIRSLSSQKMDFRFSPWSYIISSFSKEEYIPFLVIDNKEHDWDGVKAQTGRINVNTSWEKITFTTPFEEIPVVFVTQVGGKNTFATSVHIRNVSTTGFEVAIRKESKQEALVTTENLNYLAVTPGTGSINGKKIIVGFTEEDEVGTGVSRTALVDWNTDFEHPLFFAFMQTSNDELAASLRLSSLGSNSARFFKQAERSGNATVRSETGGWMVIDYEPSSSTGIHPVEKKQEGNLIYPNPASGIIYFDNPEGAEVKISIYNLAGKKVKEAGSVSNSVDISDLPAGYYMISINGKSGKLLKK